MFNPATLRAIAYAQRWTFWLYQTSNTQTMIETPLYWDHAQLQMRAGDSIRILFFRKYTHGDPPRFEEPLKLHEYVIARVNEGGVYLIPFQAKMLVTEEQKPSALPGPDPEPDSLDRTEAPNTMSLQMESFVTRKPRSKKSHFAANHSA